MKLNLTNHLASQATQREITNLLIIYLFINYINL